LTIVRKIVRAHGGELNLESKPGTGTRVSIWLPSSES
jgi:two-component system, sporulation sensor kinase E